MGRFSLVTYLRLRHSFCDSIPIKDKNLSFNLRNSPNRGRYKMDFLFDYHTSVVEQNEGEFLMDNQTKLEGT